MSESIHVFISSRSTWRAKYCLPPFCPGAHCHMALKHSGDIAADFSAFSYTFHTLVHKIESYFKSFVENNGRGQWRLKILATMEKSLRPFHSFITKRQIPRHTLDHFTRLNLASSLTNHSLTSSSASWLMSLPNIGENILGTASTQAVHSTASRTNIPTLTTPSTVPPCLPKKKSPTPKSDSSALAYRRAPLFLRRTLKSTLSCQHHRSGLITTPLERLPSVPTERPAPKRNSSLLCSASLRLKEDFLVRRNLSRRISGVTTSSTPLPETSVTRSLSQVAGLGRSEN
jgi:hypothetical protein